MIQIERVEIRDFINYEQADIDFGPGLHAIIGKNRSGKSSIYEAVYWCFYGKTARAVKNVRRRRAPAGSQTAVSVLGKKSYGQKFDRFNIIRYIGKTGPARITMMVNGNKEAKITGNLKLDQEFIDKYLGIDDRFFLGSTLFGHNSFRFTRAKDTDRKQLLEDMLALDRFTEAKERAKAEVLSLQSEIDEAESSIQSNDGHIESMEAKLNTASIQTLKTELEVESKDLKTAERELDDHKKTWPKLNAQMDLDSAEVDIQGYRKQIAILENSISIGKATISKIEKMDKCPTCGQEVASSHKRAIKSITETMLSINTRQIKEWSAKLNEATKRRTVCEDREHFENSVHETKRNIERVQALLGASTQPLLDQIKKYKSANTRLRKELEGLQTEIMQYKFWEKGFSRQGVISFLLDEAIAELNQYIAQASIGIIDGQILPQFSTTTQLKAGVQDKISMDVLMEDEITEYEACSNSEQQRIDMMTMFGIQALIASKAEATNLVFFDEVFEGLDEDSAELVMRYIDKTFSKLSTYIMSHTQDIKFRPSGRINVVRQKGVSVIQ